jgi:alcohol dehydrogenase class IV
MAVNVRALEARAPGSPALQRYAEVARLVTGRPDARIQEGVEWVESLSVDLAIPPLIRYGVTADDIPMVAAEAQRASSTKGNPIGLRDEELAIALRHAL